MKYILGIIMVILLLAVAGCAAPTCYPPNKIIGNNCCQDSDDNDVCDYDESSDVETDDNADDVAVEEEPEEVEMEYEVADQDDEPQIQEVEMPDPEPVEEPVDPLEPGKYEIVLGEPKEYIQINKIRTYRTSRDKGIIDEITFTVRNIGGKTLNPVVELFYDGTGVNYMDEERVPEYETRIDKEYTLQKLEPGEKLVVKKSIGIRFQGIDTTKRITMSVAERYVSPKKDLGSDKEEFIPTDLFESMKIYTYGLPEEAYD